MKTIKLSDMLRPAQLSTVKRILKEEKVKTIKLGNILSPAQIKEVQRILKSSHDSLERVRRLKDYFSTFSDDLERQGVYADFLAYATEYAATQPKPTKGKKP